MVKKDLWVAQCARSSVELGTLKEIRLSTNAVEIEITEL